ncbi:MAG: ABC transporter permease [Chloroflexi bacterium]|nr:ABC transporter permease [Chloroflexota bacterium]
MLQDILTVIWKETKEVLLQGGTRGRWWLLLFIGVFGVFMPLQTGPQWLTSPLSLLAWAWIPPFLVSSYIADSFAGERERHTLETLLASRLSDRAILLGKVAASVVFAWGLSVVALLLGAVAINVAYHSGGLAFYPGWLAAGALAFSLFTALLASGLGVLFSLRAATVRQAQQALSLAVVALVWVPILAANLLPNEWKARLVGALGSLDLTAVVIVALVVLVGLSVAALLAAQARFRRSRLITD